MAAKSFRFKPRKAMQAVGVLIDNERSKQMSYYRVLKLLYIADREYLAETGRPITGGRYVAMDQGPLNSPLYDLIKKERTEYPEWSKFFRTEGRNLEMLDNPGNEELSRREIRKLLDVAKRLEDRDDDEIGAITHDFPEYKKHYRENTSRTIPLEDIVVAIGRSADSKAILDDARTASILDSILGG